jgi:hypothetical protein
MSPQVGAGFNRDYWARFEKLVKDVVKHADGVYVVTGPLFLPQPDGETNKWTMKYPMIGEGRPWRCAREKGTGQCSEKSAETTVWTHNT